MSVDLLAELDGRMVGLEDAQDEQSTFEDSSKVVFSFDNVSDPPTDAQLDTAFGTPAIAGAGFVGLLDDAGGDTDVWLVATNGVSWFYSAKLTKAV